MLLGCVVALYTLSLSTRSRKRIRIIHGYLNLWQAEMSEVLMSVMPKYSLMRCTAYLRVSPPMRGPPLNHLNCDDKCLFPAVLLLVLNLEHHSGLTFKDLKLGAFHLAEVSINAL